ncbi:MAG TPA: M6 family metalloprotease domain-containing protein, partial [Bacteroidales bacterium]|nr:M6 family metalloprotease domain-containing protein [Bacteroidales bacterium]
MKKKLLLALCLFLASFTISTASVIRNQPYEVHQPDGSVIHCFVSGDEYFNWLHDANGYTIIQAADGYYYYGIRQGDIVVASGFKVNQVDPQAAGLRKWAKISSSEYQRLRSQYQTDNNSSVMAPHTGTMNNIVIYIKFSDDSEFATTRQTYDDLFNLPTGVSLKSYYTEVSYNQFTISSTHYPECAMTTNLSYTDTHPRSYFQPYNATTNPNGYSTDNERRLREHALLRDAVIWINANSAVPAGLNIDGDNDGYVDNVCFIIRGGNGAWASLLWAHRWVLYTYNVSINGKQVWDYTFQPESQVDVTTLCHEMFHALGAPDLYHYDDGGLNISPVSAWDLMESGEGHMTAYMKWKYAEQSWIASIPEITASGTYTLQPLTSSTNNCYKIASPNSASEYYVVEYRKATGTYEGNLPGSGLIVYRIDPSLTGNADGPPDEVYIYRPNGTTTANGSPYSAYFSSGSGRTAINDGTNPSPFLQNGNPGGLNIYNVTAAGSTISFTVGISTVQNPSGFTATPASTSQIDLEWVKNSSNNNVMLVYNTTSTFGIPQNGTAYAAGGAVSGGGTVLYVGSGTSFNHTGLNPSTTYYYKLWSVDGTNTYSNGVTANATTLCGGSSLPFSESFAGEIFPSCWSTQFSGNGAVNSWAPSVTNNAGGSACEMKSSYQNINPGVTRLILPVFNTTGITQLNLSFRYLLDDWAPGATLKIQSSTNGTTWTDEAWSLATASNNTVGPFQVNTTVTSNLNSATTYIAFTAEGDLYQYDYWYIDDVSVQNGGNQSYTITTASNPVSGGTTAGGGSYLIGQTVTVVATPATNWNFLNWTENGNAVSSEPSYSFTASANRDLVANFSMNQVTVSTTANPAAGGTTSGDGTYTIGSQVTATATPNTGYGFVNWTENGNIVSNDPSYTFIANSSVNLTANFAVLQFTVTTTANPAAGGNVSGSGTYSYNATVTVVASPYH